MRAIPFAVLCVLCCCRLLCAQCQGWLAPAISNFNDPVFAMTTWDPDGAGPQGEWLVVAGEFTQPGNHIAAWDGTMWRAFGAGIEGPVYALTTFNGELFAGGYFSMAGTASVSNVAKWNGTSWRAVGTGVFTGPVLALQSFAGELVVGGNFYLEYNGIYTGANLVRWNGAIWRLLVSQSGTVSALHVFQGNLCVGSDNVHVLDTTFSYGALPFPGPCFALTTHQGELFAAGSFRSAFTQDDVAVNIARWSGSGNRRPVSNPGTYSGPSFNGAIFCVQSFGGRLLVGGAFTSIGGVEMNHLATWTPENGWAPMDGGSSGPPFAMQGFGSTAYVGGLFVNTGTVPNRFLGRWTNLAAPSITTQPSPQHVSAGDPASFMVEANSPQGPLTYAWRHDGNLVSDGPGGVSPAGGVVTGAHTPHLQILNALQADAGEYTCDVSNGCATTQTVAAALIVTPVCEPDFNRDGNVDQDDVAALINVIAGGDCP